MSKHRLSRIAAFGAVLALGAAPAALAAGSPDSPGSQGLAHAGGHAPAGVPGPPQNPGPPSDAGESAGHSKAGGKAVVSYVFRGTYDGSGNVDVTSGNAHVRKADLVGTTVSFDLTNARVVVTDTNGDGTKNADDVASGDRVVVKARLPRTDPGAQPFDAKQLVDQTHNSSPSGD